MATLTIRDLDDSVKQRLRVRAAEKGVSMEAEVRSILQSAVADAPRETPGDWYLRLRERIAQTGFVDDVPIPPRDEMVSFEPFE